jgi:Family of unknown function (DUF5343)
MDNEEKKTTPSYLSVRKIGEMVDLVSSRNYPEGITAEFFKSRGFGPADATLAVNTLKFLNLLKDDGMPTEAMEKMRIKGDERKPEFEKIVRLAYKKLFDTVDDPHLLPKEKLATEFIAVYKLSDRIVTGAIPAFYKFCEYAGMRDEKAVTPRRSAPTGTPRPVSQTKKTTTSNNKEAMAPRAGFSAVPVADGRLEVHMPEDLKNKLLDDEDLGTIWVKARSALKELADAYKKPTTPEPTTEEDI